MTRELFASVLERAVASPRRRMNFNFHGSDEENPSRMLNVLLRGAYITPHRHADPAKAESFVALDGRVAAFVFDDEGRVILSTVIGPDEDAIGIDLAPGVWHTVAALSEHAVCFEVKPGPYSAANDKEFAPWAPREGDPGAGEYLERLVAEARS